VAQERLRALGHDGSSERIALIRAEVVAVPPPAADQLFEVGAGVEVLVVGG
jgi:hypothetical protein